MIKRICFLGVLILCPYLLYASIEISEIMYDVPGMDGKHEWIEIQNIGSNSIDVTTFRLFEAEVNHKINPFQGSSILEPNTYAVIADDANTFLLDYPSFSGQLFDSVFSLANEGENISIRNSDLIDLFSFSYNPSLGASGDGNSLHKVGLGWKALKPSPGEIPSAEAIGVSTTATSTIAFKVAKPHRTREEIEKEKVTYDFIQAEIVSKDTFLTDIDVEFSVKALNREGTELKTGNYKWNMGDGTVRIGNPVYHMYKAPGTYIVHLYVQGDGKETEDIKEVEVLGLNITLEHVIYGSSTSIFVKNNTSENANLSLWKIVSKSSSYIFPPHTYLKGYTTLLFNLKDFPTSKDSFISLYTGEGTLVSIYTEENITQGTSSDGLLLKESSLATGAEEVATTTLLEVESTNFSSSTAYQQISPIVASVNAVYEPESRNQENKISERKNTPLMWIGVLVGIITIATSIIFLAYRKLSFDT